MAFARAGIRVGLLALLLAALPAVAWAQAFDALTPEQREMLEPLAGVWEQIPPPRREHLVKMADRVAGESPEEQERFQRGLERFMDLDDDERRQVRRLFERFGHLPPGERREIIRRVMAMPPEERRAFAFGMRIADRTSGQPGPPNGRPGGLVEAWLRELPPDRRRELLQELQDLPAPERLRRIADEMEAAAGQPEAGNQPD